eukprot:TRINITY_DN2823_c2_g1_i1.p1 TRINITY_DN2823_c2_g1~~TRINITY_DN2823_c2_g1_i1.p1  ORF type:complete len:242 (+),score=-15.67 TRINITY_DN2823_c2_g1_i1:106-831(+)
MRMCGTFRRKTRYDRLQHISGTQQYVIIYSLRMLVVFPCFCHLGYIRVFFLVAEWFQSLFFLVFCSLFILQKISLVGILVLALYKFDNQDSTSLWSQFKDSALSTFFQLISNKLLIYIQWFFFTFHFYTWTTIFYDMITIFFRFKTVNTLTIPSTLIITIVIITFTDHFKICININPHQPLSSNCNNQTDNNEKDLLCLESYPLLFFLSLNFESVSTKALAQLLLHGQMRRLIKLNQGQVD